MGLFGKSFDKKECAICGRTVSCHGNDLGWINILYPG